VSVFIRVGDKDACSLAHIPGSAAVSDFWNEPPTLIPTPLTLILASISPTSDSDHHSTK
jgi:hypothetical protein